MANSDFEKKERHKKRRRKWKYETAMLGREEIEMMEAEAKNGIDISDSPGNRTSHTI